jgi:hypothetical protein
MLPRTQALKVAAFNAVPGNPQVILGGTSIVNSAR